MLHSVASRLTPTKGRPRFVVAIGTRPEAIKLAPVVAELRARAIASGDSGSIFVCLTGQHREAVRDVLGLYGITPDYDLALLTPGQSLATLSARILSGFENVLAQLRPEWVIVQGDTATTAMAGLAAFYAGIKVAHVEAGLRSRDLENPFPEELNRRMVSLFTTVHFAATATAKHNLLREGVPPARIYVTGNTGIDALLTTANRLQLTLVNPYAGASTPVDLTPGERPLRVLITAHRRENLQDGIHNICLAVHELALRHPGRYQFVWPQHPNPQIGAVVQRHLSQTPGVSLIAPASYDRLLKLMHRCDLILTDSGGIQEEAPSFGKPVLILRETTERPEGIDAGVAWLIGTDPARIVTSVEQLSQQLEQGFGLSIGNPYGDGHAAVRIVDHLTGLPVAEFGASPAANYIPYPEHYAGRQGT